MRAIGALLLVPLLVVPAAAVSRKRQCQQACGALAGACTTAGTELGFGDLRKGCKRAVMKLCKRDGPAVCGTYCGDGVAGAGESCDGADLGGASCEQLGFLGGQLACTARCAFDPAGCVTSAFPATGQTSSVIAGDDGALLRGAPLRYVDNGDGTVTDTNTGLMWEQKSYDDGLHYKDFHHTWSVTPSVWEWVASLNAENGTGFAGHSDWRIPNVKELLSIVNYGNAGFAVSPEFNAGCTPGCSLPACSCTEPSFVWTSTTFTADPSSAWFVDFANGFVGNALKTTEGHVRAVRGP